MQLWCEGRLSSSQDEEEEEEEEAFPEFVAEEVESDYSDLEVGSLGEGGSLGVRVMSAALCCAGYIDGS